MTDDDPTAPRDADKPDPKTGKSGAGQVTFGPDPTRVAEIEAATRALLYRFAPLPSKSGERSRMDEFQDQWWRDEVRRIMIETLENH
jgi:hypothetical protein